MGFDEIAPLLLFVIPFFGMVILVAVMAGRSTDKKSRPYDEERERAKELEQTGLRVGGHVNAWNHVGGGSEDYPGYKLRVSYSVDGHQLSNDLDICIDRGLLLAFSPGRTINLLVDPQNPQRISLDRARSQNVAPGINSGRI